MDETLSESEFIEEFEKVKQMLATTKVGDIYAVREDTLKLIAGGFYLIGQKKVLNSVLKDYAKK